ncbi:hypothetical protein [Ekhidna sp.]|uniref:hypothetical protein n=1 Tax=Ekhidna sp. TaxID=2608089 RepID=UPI003516ED84
MVISDTHQKVNALRELAPDSFVFILDTTDRSFLFKSKESPDCEQRVISLDKVHGIDKLTKTTNYYHHQDDTSDVKISRISQNTYIGLCAQQKQYTADQMEMVKECLLATVF